MAKSGGNAVSSADDTPMMRQYNRIKAEFPDAILFYRMGDFYEMFGDDARKASEVLGIALTSRSKGPDALPMAGVPHHSSETYLARLIRAGLKVAVCDQMEDPRTAKGVVKREVVRVITPGTVYEESIVPTDANVYVAALKRERSSFSVAYADVSTGEFAAETVAPDRLAAELNRLAPKEILIPRSDTRLGEAVRRECHALGDVAIEQLDDRDFDAARVLPRLKEHFGPDQPWESEPWIPAACGLFCYLSETQRGNLGQFTRVKTNTLATTMAVDARSLRNLEILYSFSGKRSNSLIGVVDYSTSPMGARLLRQWLSQPLTDLSRIRRRQELVRAFLDHSDVRDRLRDSIKGMCDLERVTAKAAAKRCGPRDLAALRDTLARVEKLAEMLAAAPQPFGMVVPSLDPQKDLLTVLENNLAPVPPAALGEGPVINSGVDPELDELREIHKGGKNWIAKYQRQEVQRTGIPNLKVGYNTVFGYYIEVTKAQIQNVPDDYIRKQTLVNAERYITPELKEYESRVLSAQDRILEIERRLFGELCALAAERSRPLSSLATLLASLDVLAGFSVLMVERRYTIPEVTESTELNIKDGRHPVVEANLPVGTFVPNDTVMDDKGFIHVITGPNMAGKSTYIRQVAQIIILAQSGAPVPAACATVGMVDRLFTRIGAGDDLAQGRSTFMVEMLETAEILGTATPRSLIILDEVGRGTSTFDGLSLAWAITEHIADTRSCNARTLFATHYHELTGLARTRGSVRNYNVIVREKQGEVVFLHRIEPGGSDRSYGIHVARLAGLPPKAIKRASEILRLLERQSLDIEGKPRGIPRGGRNPNAADSVQLLLFESPFEHLLDRVREVDIESMTPLEALALLSELKKELE